MDPRITNKRHAKFVVYFNCGHASCTECALKWRERCTPNQSTCPLCRKNIESSLRGLELPLPDADPQYQVLTPTHGLLEAVTEELPNDCISFPFPKGACFICAAELKLGSIVKKHSVLTSRFVCAACAGKPVPNCRRCERPCNHHDPSGHTTLRNTAKEGCTYLCAPCVELMYEANGKSSRGRCVCSLEEGGIAEAKRSQNWARTLAHLRHGRLLKWIGNENEV